MVDRLGHRCRRNRRWIAFSGQLSARPVGSVYVEKEFHEPLW
jgi:hypothetical protein